jgi:hypothetical protein
MYQKLAIREAHVRALDALRPEQETTAKEAVNTRETTRFVQIE